ncbi:MAG TPA: hypothetical protein VF570_12210, partial [Pyrinomonadaceae bacterium]
MATSLALGILVSDLRGYRFLTSAHAQARPCQGRGLHIGQGIGLSGITVRNIIVNGQLVEEGVIAGSVLVVDSTGYNVKGVIVGNDLPSANGVIVGNDRPSANGVIVGNDGPSANGVIVGNDRPSANGVIVGNDVIASGGTLTGDGVTVTGGVITGQNL